MTIEYYLHKHSPYPHETSALLHLARLLQQAFAHTERFYLLAANVRFWQNQADAILCTPHSITLIELKAYDTPIYGRAQNTWYTLPENITIHGGSAQNPYQQIVAQRQNLIKYLDRNRRRFLNGDRVRTLKGKWGHVSGALVFTPRLHPESDIIVPPTSRAWLGVIGLNEVNDFVYARTSPQIDLRPQELRHLATQTLGCQPWNDLAPLLTLNHNAGRLWVLNENGQRAYAIAAQDGTTIGRSRENTLIVPRHYSRTSRRHATLRLQDNTLVLYDQHSTYGTFVNGKQIQADHGHPLQHGDTITLGSETQFEACTLTFDTRPSTVSTTDLTATTQQP